MEQNELNHIDILESWMYWNKTINKNPDKFNDYKFPDPLRSWKEKMGQQCPICYGGYGSGIVTINGVNKKILCVCSILDWLHDRYYLLKEYESAVKPAYLDELKPLGINKKADDALIATIKFVNNWFEDPSHSWITLYGGNGVGKTHILRAIKTKLDGLCVFISADKLQQQMFSAINNDKSKIEELIDHLTNIPILLLDDWGLEHDNLWTTDTIASIINTRYMFPEYYPTVITFNMTKASIVGSISTAKKRIASRIFDEQISYCQELLQPDYRLEETKEMIVPPKSKNIQWGKTNGK